MSDTVTVPETKMLNRARLVCDCGEPLEVCQLIWKGRSKWTLGHMMGCRDGMVRPLIQSDSADSVLKLFFANELVKSASQSGAEENSEAR